MAIPATNMTTLWPQLNQLMATLLESKPLEFEVSRLERDVQRQISSGVDVAEAYSGLAIVKLARGDIAGFRHAGENSLRLTADRAVHVAYAGLLRHSLFFSESFAKARALAELYPDDLKVLTLLAKSAAACLQFDVMEDVCGMYQRLKAPEELYLRTVELLDEPDTQFARRRLEENGLTPQVLADIMDVAGEVVRERFTVSPGWSIGSTPSGNIAVTLIVRGTADEIADTGFAIAEAMVEKDLDRYGEWVTVSCDEPKSWV